MERISKDLSVKMKFQQCTNNVDFFNSDETNMTALYYIHYNRENKINEEIYLTILKIMEFKQYITYG